MLRTRRARQRAVLAAITALAIVVGAGLYSAGALRNTLQAVVYDSFITSAPARVKNQITIVAVDEATIKKYGRYPLPRQAYADLLKALNELKAQDGVHTPPAVVAFDVSFYDPSGAAAADAALAAAIKASPTRNDTGNIVGGQVVLAAEGLGASTISGGVQRFSALQLPLKAFLDAGAIPGIVAIKPSPDARVRETGLVFEGPEGRFYNLPLTASALALRADPKAIRIEPERVVLPARPADRVMPVDDTGAMRIYYASPPATDTAQRKISCPPDGTEYASEFCVVSLADVVAGKVPRTYLAGRSIYVGVHSASAIPDNYPTPNSGDQKMFGVEIWANTAQSIYTNRYPVTDDGTALSLLQIVVVTLLGIAAVGRYGLRGFLAAIGGLVLYGLARYVFFASAASTDTGTGALNVASLGYLIPSTFWWVITLGYLLVEEQLAVSRTQSTFGRFVTPSVARTIMDREERGGLQLGGETKEITVLFGDIRGFTTLSEGMDPQKLMGTLNRYFDGMVAIVTRYLGTVNKYNGDNIMVLWNAPVEVPEHGRRAVECALEIQTWIQQERAKGGPDVSFGFGINSGSAVAGFLGASGRMEYTVIGDTVNVASRLTSNDIARRDQVACSQETLALLGDDVAAVDLGAIVVKGRGEPVRCFQIDRVGTIANPNPAPPPEVPVGKAAVAGFH